MARLLILDSGHAKSTGGKCAPDKSLYEWEFNNDMQYRIQKRMKEIGGVTVHLTNPNPATVKDIPLTTRANSANNKWNAMGKCSALFVSLHANAYGSGFNSARGIEVFTSKGCSSNSTKAANATLKNILAEERKIDGAMPNRGVKKENFTVIYKTSMPGILIEYAFYSNKSDLNILKYHRDALVEGTVKGICEYFGIAYKAPGSGGTTDKVLNAKGKVIKADTLNIRSSSSTSGSIVGTLKLNETFTITHQASNGWYKIKNNSGKIGYVSNSYVELVKEEPKPKQYAYCILYGNDIDKVGAEMMSWYYKDCIMKHIDQHRPWEGANLFVVGGGAVEKLKAMNTGENFTAISGSDRYETVKLCLKHIGKL